MTEAISSSRGSSSSSGGAGDAGALVGELQQVGQRRPVPLLAEVLGVGAERDLVLRLELQDRVQVDRRLIGVAQAVPVKRRQLQHDARAGGRIGDGAQLPLAQLGQLGVVVAFADRARPASRKPVRPAARSARSRCRSAAPRPCRRAPPRPAARACRGSRPAPTRRPPPRSARGSSDRAPGTGARRSRRAPAAPTTRSGPGRPAAPCAARRSRSRCRPPPAAGARPGSRWPPPARCRRRRSSSGWRRPPASSSSAFSSRGRMRTASERRCAAASSSSSFSPSTRPSPSKQIGAPAGVGGPLQLQLVEADHRAEVAQRAVDLARRLDRLEVLGGQLALPLRVADGPFQLGEVVEEELPHLRFQLGDAGGIAGARDGGRLHLQHRHVVGGAALLAVDVLEAGGGADVPRIAVDGVDQIGLRPFGVPQLVDAQLGGQVEQLAGLGVVLDRLGARLVERDQPVVLLRLTVGLPQRDERFGVGRIPLEGGFVFADGGHAREPQLRRSDRPTG